jgi:hypothetical protein
MAMMVMMFSEEIKEKKQIVYFHVSQGVVTGNSRNVLSSDAIESPARQ